MGDCRIRILIASNLIPSTIDTHSKDNSDDDDDDSDNDEKLVVITHVDSADATVRDLYNSVLKPLWSNSRENQDDDDDGDETTILQLLLPDDVCLWDCTFHPPKDVSNYLSLFGDTSGPKSKTLYDAGWFPSGTIQVLPKGRVPAISQNYDDVQYNLFVPSQQSSTVDTNTSTETPRIVPKDSLTPSQLLQSVVDRHHTTNDEESEQTQQQHSLNVRRQNRNERRVREAVRHAKLEERIRQVASSLACSNDDDSRNDKKKKNNKKAAAVSQQVRKMLIKSRCTGRSNLKPRDRIYLHMVIIGQQGGDDNFCNDDDDNNNSKYDGNDDVTQQQQQQREEFRYFSQQDTVARIINDVAPLTLPQEAELLVRHKKTSSQQRVGSARQNDDDHQQQQRQQRAPIYRRLPVTMRLYEAISAGYINDDVDFVVIRCFTPPQDEPTTCITDDDNNDDDTVVVEEEQEESSDEMMQLDSTTDAPEVVVDSGKATSPNPSLNTIVSDANPVISSSEADVNDRLDKAIAAMEEDSSTSTTKSKNKKKKASSTSTKVRAMLLKSKARGDAKRIPNIEDRFFLELVVVHDMDDGRQCTASAAVPVFLSRSDPVSRIVRDCVSVPSGDDCKTAMLVPDHGSFHVLPNDISLQDAEAKGLLKCFDRVVVRLYK